MVPEWTNKSSSSTKTLLPFCFLTVLLLITAVCAQTGRLVEHRLHSPALADNLLGDPAENLVLVYLPPTYDLEQQRRFPVLYLLHPYGAGPRLWVSPPLDLPKTMDALIQENKISPLIVVMPSAHNRYRGSFHLNSKVTGRWEDFLTQELVTFIDGTYRTLPQAASRGLAGHSMGGYGALITALRHPERFGACYGLSPCCLDFEAQFLKILREPMLAVLKVNSQEEFPNLPWRQQVVIAMAAAAAPNPKKTPFLADLPLQETQGNIVRDDLVWRRWRQHDPLTLIRSSQPQLRKLHLAFDMGTADNLLSMARTFSQALTDVGLAHTYEEFDGDHSNRLKERLTTRALPFFSRTLVHSSLKNAKPPVSFREHISR